MGQGKRYLLLRNNIQTGPYTYNELRKQSVRPSDLIWIEGESTSWSKPRFGATREPRPKDGRTAPAPYRALPVAHERPTASPEPVAYSLPGSEALPFYGPSGDSAFVRRDRAADEEAEIELILHKSHKSTVSLSQLLFAAVVTAASVLIWNNRFSFMPEWDQNITTAKRPQIFQASPPPLPGPTPPLRIVTDSLRPATAAIAPAPVPGGVQKKITPKPISKKKNGRSIKTDTPLLTLPAIEVKAEEVPVAPVIEAPPPPAVVSETPEKKKTLGQAIKGIFKKKKKRDAPAPEEQ